MGDPFLQRTAVSNDKTTWIAKKNVFDKELAKVHDEESIGYLKQKSACIDPETNKGILLKNKRLSSAANDGECQKKCDTSVDCSAYVYHTICYLIIDIKFHLS